jgi:hypothetical protein
VDSTGGFDEGIFGGKSSWWLVNLRRWTVLCFLEQW